MLRRILPRRVAVSLGVACVFVGGVVLAGALLRHRDASHPVHRSPSAGPSVSGTSSR
ncbi:MAG TPA: hypothetical protein VG869_07505 [Acidimicrobiia bacterium]|nr:hypothetical protein [Acidimicrobiia bacterium]